MEPLIAQLGQRRGGPDDGAIDPPDTWADDEPVLAGLAAASVEGTIALGRRRGARLRRLGEPAEPVETPDPGSRHARANGFDLHASVVVPAGAGERLEHPAVRAAAARGTGTAPPDSRWAVRLDLRHRWRDGTTGIVGRACPPYSPFNPSVNQVLGFN